VAARRQGRKPPGERQPIARGRRPTFDALVAKYGDTPAGRDKAARIANYGKTKGNRRKMARKAARTRKAGRR
jgi:hypothetical protein